MLFSSHTCKNTKPAISGFILMRPAITALQYGLRRCNNIWSCPVICVRINRKHKLFCLESYLTHFHVSVVMWSSIYLKVPLRSHVITPWLVSADELSDWLYAGGKNCSGNELHPFPFSSLVKIMLCIVTLRHVGGWSLCRTLSFILSSFFFFFKV